MVTITEIVEEILNFTSHFYALSDIREFGREIGFDFDPIADKLTPLTELISSTISFRVGIAFRSQVCAIDQHVRYPPHYYPLATV